MIITDDFTRAIRRPSWGSVAPRKHVNDFHGTSDVEMISWDSSVVITMERGVTYFGDLRTMLAEKRP